MLRPRVQSLRRGWGGTKIQQAVLPKKRIQLNLLASPPPPHRLNPTQTCFLTRVVSSLTFKYPPRPQGKPGIVSRLHSPESYPFFRTGPLSWSEHFLTDPRPWGLQSSQPLPLLRFEPCIQELTTHCLILFYSF